ncbi:MAG: hypothetical protein GY943_10500 [Chloroflexi bacterium]|nr:hypothetical protein [Chloroflexota bacterium]
MEAQFDAGAIIKTEMITSNYSFSDFHVRHGVTAVPMFVIDGDTLQVGGADCPLDPKPGNKLISLVMPQANKNEFSLSAK